MQPLTGLIELLAVSVIVFAIIMAAITFARQSIANVTTGDRYRRFCTT